MPGIYINDSNLKRGREFRNDLFDDEDDEIAASSREKRKRGSDAAEVYLDEYYDPELREPAVQTVAKAVGITGQLKDFAQYYGHEERSFTLTTNNNNNNNNILLYSVSNKMCDCGSANS